MTSQSSEAQRVVAQDPEESEGKADKVRRWKVFNFSHFENSQQTLSVTADLCGSLQSEQSRNVGWSRSLPSHRGYRDPMQVCV